MTATVARIDDGKATTSLVNVIRSEWTKIWSVRSTLWALLSLMVVTIGVSGLIAWGSSGDVAERSAEQLAGLDPTSEAMSGLMLGQLIIAALGVMVVCAEYSTGGIRATLIAVPNRLRVLAAKGIVFAAVATVVGMITAFGAFFLSMRFWARYDLDAHLGDPNVLRAVIGGGLYVLAAGMFGFAIGVLVRHTAAAVATVVGLLFVAPLMTPLLPGEWGHQIDKYFTVNPGHHITDVVLVSGQTTPWMGYAVLTVEWIVPLVIGAYLMKRRDA